MLRDNTYGAKGKIMDVECRGENQLKILPKAKEKKAGYSSIPVSLGELYPFTAQEKLFVVYHHQNGPS